MQNNINSTLVDVRKAYRLLFDFQSRIMDLVSFIGGTYAFEYDGGHIKFSNIAPSNGKGSLKDSAWRFLPMYFYDFHFKQRKINNNNIYFSVFLIADTGYFENLKDNLPNKKDVDTFHSVEESKTKLLFVAGKNKWGNSSLNDQNWNNIEFTLQDSGIDIKDVDGGIMIFKSYELNNFLDEDKAMETMRNFQYFARQHSIDFIIKEKDLQ